MDEQAFAHQLFQGLGRPYLHLQRHSAAPYLDALLRASLTNPVYDWQVEGSRADYLFELLLLTGELPVFERHILEALAAPGEDADTDQLCAFARIFARRGTREARELLYQRCAASIASDDDEGVSPVIELDGVNGFLFVIERMDQHAPADPTDPPDDSPLVTLRAELGADEADRILAAMRQSHPAVERYLAAVEIARQKRKQAAQRHEALYTAPYSELKRAIGASQGRYPFGLLRRWGREAADGDVHAAAHDLIHQTDPQHLITYLSVFLSRPFPLPWEHLRPLVYHEHERVARLAVHCIQRIEHPQIRALAFELDAAGTHTGDVVGLFTRNYRVGDERFFAELLARTVDIDVLHAIGLDIRDVYETNDPLPAVSLLLELYQRGPCSLCRGAFVDLLIAARHVPEWLATECAHDAEPETRASIHAYLHGERTN